MIFFPCLRSCLKLSSRETGSAIPSRLARWFSTIRLNLVLIHGIIPALFPRRRPSIPSTAIGSVPSLSGHEIAYRWRSLPTVCRHKATSNPQGSSSRLSKGCCLVRYRHKPINFVDARAGVIQETNHTGFFHLPSAVPALNFLAKRIQPSLSPIDREVEFCVPTK